MRRPQGKPGQTDVLLTFPRKSPRSHCYCTTSLSLHDASATASASHLLPSLNDAFTKINAQPDHLSGTVHCSLPSSCASVKLTTPKLLVRVCLSPPPLQRCCGGKLRR